MTNIDKLLNTRLAELRIEEKILTNIVKDFENENLIPSREQVIVWKYLHEVVLDIRDILKSKV